MKTNLAGCVVDTDPVSVAAGVQALTNHVLWQGGHLAPFRVRVEGGDCYISVQYLTPTSPPITPGGIVWPEVNVKDLDECTALTR